MYLLLLGKLRKTATASKTTVQIIKHETVNSKQTKKTNKQINKKIPVWQKFLLGALLLKHPLPSLSGPHCLHLESKLLEPLVLQLVKLRLHV